MTGPVIHANVIQGTDEWLAMRCGLLTASEMKLIVTLGGKKANNDKERAHLNELLAQRITRFVEPFYVSADMLRGQEDEIKARQLYHERYAPVTEVGFITNGKWGFTLGYSPDGLVGDDGLIECKSRRQKFQVETILANEVPDDFVLQVQTGLLVSERAWLDFVSYSGGLPMCVIRAFPDEAIQTAILEAAQDFEKRLYEKMGSYYEIISDKGRFIPTERTVIQEMFV